MNFSKLNIPTNNTAAAVNGGVVKCLGYSACAAYNSSLVEERFDDQFIHR